MNARGEERNTVLDLGSSMGQIGRVNVADMLRRSAGRFPGRTAIGDPWTTFTYAELDAQVNRAARGLDEAGVDRQAFVALLAGSRVETIVAYLACARSGRVALPVNPSLQANELAHIFGETSPRAVVTTTAVLERLAPVLADVGSVEHVYVVDGDGDGIDGGGPFAHLLSADDSEVNVATDDRQAVQCLYTSGTTALPKGVVTSHVAATFSSLSVAHTLRLTEDSVGLAPLPLHHVAGLNSICMTHLMVGAAIHLMPAWDARHAAAEIERLGVTNMILAGPMWIELTMRAREIGADLSTLRVCVVGMANLVEERAAELRELVAPDAYVFLASGMTEFTSWQTAQRPAELPEKAASWGSPALMTEVAIMDHAGNLLPAGETGEIVYRGPSAMNGYLGQPEATERQCTNGWFRTGDLGYMDEDRVVWFVDRLKDMIKTGGENVSSLEVTDVLFAHPAVADCAIVGLPHERWAEAVTAFVTPHEGASVTAEELIEHCSARLARFKVPKQIVFVDAFPRTGSGKIQKNRLREQYSALYEEPSRV